MKAEVIGLIASTVLGVGGVAGTVYYRRHYSDSGSATLSKQLVVLDNVLVDIVIALKSNPSEDKVPVDQFIARPYTKQSSRKGDYVAISGDTSSGEYAMRNLRTMAQRYGRTPEGTEGFGPAMRVKITELIAAVLYIIKEIISLPEGFFTSTLTDIKFMSCTLPGVGENKGILSRRRGTRKTVADTLLAPLMYLIMTRLNRSESDHSVSREDAVRICKYLKRTMFLGACYFKINPRGYLRQRYSKLVRSPGHPFHRNSRIADVAERLVAFSYMDGYGNLGSTSFSKNRCFPQMLMFYKTGLQFLMAAYKALGGKDLRFDLKEIQNVSPSRPMNDDVAKAMAEQVIAMIEDLKNKLTTLEAGIPMREIVAHIESQQEAIMEEAKKIAAVTKFFNGNGNVNINMTKGIPDLKTGEMSVDITVKKSAKSGENPENSNWVKEVNKDEYKKTVPVQALNKNFMEKLSTNMKVPRAFEMMDMPQDMSDLLIRVDTAENCDFVNLVLSQTWENSERTVKNEDKGYLRCHKRTDLDRKTVRFVLAGMRRLLKTMQAYQVLNRKMNNNLATSDQSSLLTIQDSRLNRISSAKVSLLRATVDFVGPMTLVAASNNCYIRTQEIESMLKVVKGAMNEALYLDMTPEGLSLETNAPESNVRVGSKLKNETLNSVLKVSGLKVHRNLDDRFAARYVNEKLMNDGYGDLMAVDYNVRDKNGFLLSTGYENLVSSNYNTLIFCTQMLASVQFCINFNEKNRDLNLFINVFPRPAPGLEKKCKDMYDKTLQEFYTERSKLRKNANAVQESVMRTRKSTWLSQAATYSAVLSGLGIAGAVGGAVGGAAGAATGFGFLSGLGKYVGAGVLRGAGLAAALYKNQGFITDVIVTAMEKVPGLKRYAATLKNASEMIENRIDNFLGIETTLEKEYAEMTPRELQRDRFQGYKFSENTDMKMFKEIMGGYTKQVREDVYIKSGTKLTDETSGIIMITDLPIPVWVVLVKKEEGHVAQETQIKEAQRKMEQFTSRLTQYTLGK
jgi:hypothetical protein